MTDKEKLMIAQWLGWHLESGKYKTYFGLIHISLFRFDSDWNWAMYLVNKLVERSDDRFITTDLIWLEVCYLNNNKIKTPADVSRAVINFLKEATWELS
jgi:hypothetical protein